MYALLGAVVLFELFLIYFVVVTAFKSELQIQQIRDVLAGPLDAGAVRVPVHPDPACGVVPQHHAQALGSTALSVLVASLGAYGWCGCAGGDRRSERPSWWRT